MLIKNSVQFFFYRIKLKIFEQQTKTQICRYLSFWKCVKVSHANCNTQRPAEINTQKKEVKNQNHWKLFSCFFFHNQSLLHILFYTQMLYWFFLQPNFLFKIELWRDTSLEHTNTWVCVFLVRRLFFSSNNKNETYSMFYKIIIMIVCVCVFLSP